MYKGVYKGIYVPEYIKLLISIDLFYSAFVTAAMSVVYIKNRFLFDIIKLTLKTL